MATRSVAASDRLGDGERGPRLGRRSELLVEHIVLTAEAPPADLGDESSALVAPGNELA